MKPVIYLALLILAAGLFLGWNLLASYLTNQSMPSAEPAEVRVDATSYSAVNQGPFFHGTLIPGTDQLLGFISAEGAWGILDPSERTVTPLPDLLTIADIPLWIAPSPQADGVIVQSKHLATGTITTRYLSRTESAEATLSPAIIDLAWLPDGSAIVYLYWNETARTFQLATATPTGADWKILLPDIPFLVPELTLAPDGKKVLISRQPNSDADRTPTDQSLILFHLEAGTTQPLPITEIAVSPVWAPDSQKIAYHYAASAGQPTRLGLFNLATSQEVQIRIDTATGYYAWQTGESLLVANTNRPQSLWQITTDQQITPVQKHIEPPASQLLILPLSQQPLLIRHGTYIPISLTNS